MRKIILFILLVASVSVFSYDATLNDFDTGMKLAKLEQKQLIVMFSDPSCYYCSLFIKNTLPDENVIKLLKAGYVFVEIYPVNKTAKLEISGEKQEVSYSELYSIFGVRGTPTFWFFSEQATPITSLPGYVEPEFFVNVLQFLGEKVYENGVTFADYSSQSHDYVGSPKLINLSDEDARYVLENDPLAVSYSADLEFDPFRIWVTSDPETANGLISKGAYRVILITSSVE